MQGPWLEPLRSEPETKGEPLGLSSHSPRLPGDRHSGSPRGRGWGACWLPRRPLRSGLVRSAQGTAPGGDEVSEPRGKNVSLTPGGRAGGGHRFCDGSCSVTAQGSGGDLPAAGCPKAPGRGIRSSEVAGSEPAASWLRTPGAAPGGGPHSSGTDAFPRGSDEVTGPPGSQGPDFPQTDARLQLPCWEGPRRMWTGPWRRTPGIGPALLLITPCALITAAWPVRGVC